MKLRLNEIENELLNNKKIGIKGLVAICLLHKINVIYIWDRKYMEYINNNEEDTNVIVTDEKQF